MEETQVVIVGGGPSGLTLGLSLAQHQIHSVILEKADEVTTDPRGVWLTGDGVRIMHALGLGHEMSAIGYDVPHVNFHHSTFNTVPFFRIQVESSNAMEQALPEGFAQSQPKLEYALRRAIEKTDYCSLRTGCEVTGRTSEVPPKIQYMDAQGAPQEIQGQWLVGADGKMGIVRKHFLEPTAGIRQQTGVYPYEGVWVASNLKLSLPTSESHPDFPLWALGYTPEEVYDLFWPVGWHFCSPPGRPTATGRFGPREDRTWRHEFRVDESKGPIYSAELLWEHIMPSITLQKDDSRGIKFDDPVVYPQDCIRILRCRPFKFVHKCVNRWYDKRTLLIGDAAHVFPPFAGQGIASGMRDAHQLSWRLALLLRGENPGIQTEILDSWACERRRSVDDAAMMSKASGRICNNQPSWWVLAVAWVLGHVESIPSLQRYNMVGVKERSAFYGVSGGFFLEAYNGGARLAQIHVRSSRRGEVLLSDKLLQQPEGTIFNLLVINNGDTDEGTRLLTQAEEAVMATALPYYVLSRNSIVCYNTQESESPFESEPADKAGTPKVSPDIFSPASVWDITAPLTLGYNSVSYLSRIGHAMKFVIARPDLFTFACAKNVDELLFCLAQLKKMSI